MDKRVWNDPNSLVVPTRQFSGLFFLLKGPRTKQQEIKKTIAIFLKIVVAEDNDWILWECILLPWRDKMLGEQRIHKADQDDGARKKLKLSSTSKKVKFNEVNSRWHSAKRMSIISFTLFITKYSSWHIFLLSTISLLW